MNRASIKPGAIHLIAIDGPFYWPLVGTRVADYGQLSIAASALLLTNGKETADPRYARLAVK